MVEPEMVFTNLDKIITLAERLVKFAVNYVLVNNLPELEYLEKHNQKKIIDKLKRLAGDDLIKVDYNQCVEILTGNRENFTFNDIK